MKNNKRRYFLHKKVKMFCKMNVFKREVYVTDDLLSGLDDEQKKYLFELRDLFRYNLQFIIE